MLHGYNTELATIHNLVFVVISLARNYIDVIEVVTVELSSGDRGGHRRVAARTGLSRPVWLLQMRSYSVIRWY